MALGDLYSCEARAEFMDCCIMGNKMLAIAVWLTFEILKVVELGPLRCFRNIPGDEFPGRIVETAKSLSNRYSRDPTSCEREHLHRNRPSEGVPVALPQTFACHSTTPHLMPQRPHLECLDILSSCHRPVLRRVWHTKLVAQSSRTFRDASNASK